MVIKVANLSSSFRPLRSFEVKCKSLHQLSSQKLLEESIRVAVQTKTYQQIPEILGASKEYLKSHNPFSFLTTFPEKLRVLVIDEILQCFSSIRPRCRPRIGYSSLLSYALQSPNPLPVGLAILQRSLRSGCSPAPQIHLLLSTAWLERRRQSQSVSTMLLEMQSMGYHPDCGICNYLISSLCKVDQVNEAVNVLKGMSGAGCIPDLDSFGVLIGQMCELRMTAVVVRMMQEMIATFNLNPRQETVMKVMAMLRANKEIWKAVKLMELLETQDVHVGFKSYELVLEGCLECREFMLAGNFAMDMTGRGFIPLIGVRQKVFEGLASVDEWELACSVRHRFTELNS